MLRNYFKIAFRNLYRNKVFSLTNIFGLALGIATCLLIMIYVQNELSYDRVNKKADQIVRVVFKGEIQGEKMKEASVMPPTAWTLKADYPEVLDATRLRKGGYPRIDFGDKIFNEVSFAYADSNFFRVFTLPFLEGDMNTALLQTNSIVISEDVAHKFFGNTSAMGKMIHFKDDNTSYKVTGVMRRIPANSHFHFDMFASMITNPESRQPSWMSSEYYTYLVLPVGYDYKNLEAKLPQVVEKYMGPQLQTAMGMNLAQFRQKGNDIGLFLEPLKNIYLHSDVNLQIESVGDIRYVYIFSAVALFMLIIACINFMNLSTASASKRAREVGIRKVMGSLKQQLVKQFLTESVLISVIAMMIALAIAYWVLPFYNELSGKNLSLNLISNVWIIPALLVMVLITGILAGSYPAFFLSSFKPVSVLKGKFSNSKSSSGLRSGLVVFQFFISIVLIVGTTVVYKQLSYIQHIKLGYNKDQVVVIEQSFWLGKNQDAYKEKLLQDPRVVSLTGSGYLPAGYSYNNNFTVYPDNKSDQLIKTLKYDVDYTYIPTLGMELAKGRNFSKEYGTDSLGLVINESAAKAFGFGENALGKTITNSDNSGLKTTFHVLGVVKDFHFKSMHEKISPLIMVLARNYDNIIVKTNTKNVSALLESMKKLWTSYKAEAPFVFSFLDERFKNTYQAEQKMGTILGIFAGLTIFVACLGLFALATFTAEQRTKEIGIRKVLGATAASIVSLLSKDFLKLVMIAFLIATPVAWYLMSKWLQDFAYPIKMNGWIFAFAALLAMAITLLTVSFRAIRAAMANPADSLHAE